MITGAETGRIAGNHVHCRAARTEETRVFHKKTQRRLQRLFAGKQCRQCGSPAQRLWRHKYYCQDCFPVRPRSEVQVRSVAERDLA
jgi:hypothetical protein